MSQQQFEHEVMSEEEMQSALPPHKRDGYAERMYELNDMRRKAEREDNLIRSNNGQS